MNYGSVEYERLRFLSNFGFRVENHSNGRYIEIICVRDDVCITYHEWRQFNDFNIFITKNIDDLRSYQYVRTYDDSWFRQNVLPAFKQNRNVKLWSRIDLVEFYLRNQIKDRKKIFEILLF